MQENGDLAELIGRLQKCLGCRQGQVDQIGVQLAQTGVEDADDPEQTALNLSSASVLAIRPRMDGLGHENDF